MLLHKLQKIAFSFGTQSRAVSQQPYSEVAFVTEQSSDLARRMIVVNGKFLFKWGLFTNLANPILSIEQPHVFVNRNSVASLDKGCAHLHHTQSLAPNVAIALCFMKTPKLLPARRFHILTMLSIAFLLNIIRHCAPSRTSISVVAFGTFRSPKREGVSSCASPLETVNGLNRFTFSTTLRDKWAKTIRRFKHWQVVIRASSLLALIAVRMLAVVAKSRDWLNDKTRGAFLFGYTNKSQAIHPPMMNVFGEARSMLSTSFGPLPLYHATGEL